MALNSLPVRDLCCAGELGLSRNPPGVWCQAVRCLQLRAAHHVFGAVQPFKWPRRSWWLGLSWVLARSLHSRHGIATAKHHQCSGSSARQTGHTGMLPGSCQGVP